MNANGSWFNIVIIQRVILHLHVVVDVVGL